MDRQQENNGFGPFSKSRGNASLLAALFVVAFCTVVHLKIAHSTGNQQGRDEVFFLLFISALLTLSLAVGEVVRRACLGIEEIQHRQTRYEGSWTKVFNSTFAFKYARTILVVGVASFLIVSFALYLDCDTFCRAEYAIFFSLNCFLAPQLLFLVGLRELSSVEVSEINERENKNVADGLAWSYYFGYLKLVLPHLEGQIGKSDYKYKITKKKLFILLPKNCYTYATIEEADPRITVAENLDSYDINRGGILKRSYKHTVHKIDMLRLDGEVDEYHVVLEYATPLMSLYDMSQHPEGGLSRQERDEQVTSSEHTNILTSYYLVQSFLL